MEGAWPALIDALTSERPERRARLFWTSLAWVNGVWIGLSAIVLLAGWLNTGERPTALMISMMASYTLIPSILFAPAYLLWEATSRRRLPKAPPPLQLD